MTKGSLTGRFSADKKSMDLLFTSSWVVKLSVDSVSELSSEERSDMAVRR